jgi:hypothetical protein
MASADLVISYSAVSFVTDVDVEFLMALGTRMFEDSEEAGPAGNQQCHGLDAGITNQWVLGRARVDLVR